MKDLPPSPTADQRCCAPAPAPGAQEPDREEQQYRSLLDLDPSDPRANHDLGSLLLNRGQLDAARPYLEAAVRHDSSNSEARITLGLLSAFQANWGSAIDTFRKAVELRPDSARAHYYHGAALKESGAGIEAFLPCFEKAVSLDPDFVDALLNLGVSLFAAGKTDASCLNVKRAVELAPQNVKALNCYGSLLNKLGRHEEALVNIRRALELSPGSAEIYNTLGEAFWGLERFDEALGSYLKAVAAAPQYAEAHHNLGLAQMKLGRVAEALASCRRALELRPDYAAASANLGAMLVDQGRYDEALKTTQDALVLAPDDLVLLNRLGDLYSIFGRFDEAKACLTGVLAAQPTMISAFVSLSDIHEFSEKDRDLIALMETQAANQAPELCSSLHFALGKAHEELKDFQRAFFHFDAGHRCLRNKDPYDRAADESRFDQRIRVFSPQFFEARKNWGVDSIRPIFIVGLPRSGTTLIEQILSSHPDVFGAGELHFLAEQAAAIGKLTGSKTPYPEAMPALASAQLASVAEGYLALLDSRNAHARHVTDKMPANYLLIGLIVLAFPKAKIIHARRDPMDTCLSIFANEFIESHPYSHDLGDLGFHYGLYERLMAHWRRTLPPQRIYEIQYEELTASPAEEIRKLLDYCGLTWDSRCLAFHQNTRPVNTASLWQVRQPIFHSARGRWKNYEQFLQPLVSALNPGRE